jgi:hypothetical protein
MVLRYTWLLLSFRDIHSKAEIVFHYKGCFSTEDLPIVSHFSFIKGLDFEKHFDSIIEALIDEGLVMASIPTTNNCSKVLASIDNVLC